MEVIGETPPPLPPKTKKVTQSTDTLENSAGMTTAFRIIRNGITNVIEPEKNGSQSGSLKIINNRDEDGLPPPQTTLVPEKMKVTEPQSNKTNKPTKCVGQIDLSEKTFGPKIITWAGSVNKIVSDGGVTVGKKQENGKRKTPKIEVRQEEHKTVVKISVTKTPEEEMKGKDRFKPVDDNIYENGYQGENGFTSLMTNLYENCDVTHENGALYENVPAEDEQCYENVSVSRDSGFYANVTGSRNRQPKELITEANYGSQVYKNMVSIKRKSMEREGDDESYENCMVLAKGMEKNDETTEKSESGKRKDERKSAVVEVTLQKPKSKTETDYEDVSNVDDNSSGDPFDSGTCSDVDSLPTFVQTKKGNVIVTIKSLQSEEKKVETGHKRAESLTSSGVGVDSEESDDEKSNISCDSLNSNEPYSHSEDHGYHTPEDKTGSPVEYDTVMKRREEDKLEEECDKADIIQQMADASRRIKNLRMDSSGVFMAKLMESSEFEEYENIHMFTETPTYKKKPPPPPPPKPEDKTAEEMKSLPVSLLQDIRSRNVRLSSSYPSGEKPDEVKKTVADAVFNLEGVQSRKTPKSVKRLSESKKCAVVDQRTYEERKTDVRTGKVNKICAMEVDTDKFYKFHLAENVRDSGNGNANEDETFAGVKDFLSREKPAAITSAKGTIRGVRNRVKAGIATFLQFHENKSYKDRDAGKVVVYTTTMGIVRETYHKCLKVKQILRTLMVKFEERDVFMSSEAQEEIRERMKCDVILVPQVFVEGQHIGDSETIERLNEIGELRLILKPYKCADACSTCNVCGGYRLLPCNVCKGSKKSIHRNHFTAEFVSLKCMNCDQVGLTKCHAC